MNSKLKYKWINKLNIKVEDDNGFPYIKSESLDLVLNKEDREIFSKFYGVQTGLVTSDGVFGLYLWDVEDVLIRMFEKKLVGGQLFWD